MLAIVMTQIHSLSTVRIVKSIIQHVVCQNQGLVIQKVLRLHKTIYRLLDQTQSNECYSIAQHFQVQSSKDKYR